jgi:hypothetical protein
MKKEIVTYSEAFKMQVVNESPVLKAGKRKVVDRVGKGKRTMQAMAERDSET